MVVGYKKVEMVVQGVVVVAAVDPLEVVVCDGATEWWAMVYG